MSIAAESNGRPSRPTEFPTQRGRRTQAAIDAAARRVIARKGIFATTIADIAADAGRSAASFYNYYDSKEAMVRQWALRFRDEANHRALSVTQHGLSNQQRARQAADHETDEAGEQERSQCNEKNGQRQSEQCGVPRDGDGSCSNHSRAQGTSAPTVGRYGIGRTGGAVPLAADAWRGHDAL